MRILYFIAHIQPAVNLSPFDSRMTVWLKVRMPRCKGCGCMGAFVSICCLKTTDVYCSQFWRLEVQGQGVADLVSDKGYFLVHRWCLCAMSSHDGRARLLYEVFFIKTLIPLMRLHPHEVQIPTT
jgi:hypothetical protein